MSLADRAKEAAQVTNLPTIAPLPPSVLGYHRQLAPNAAVKVSPICLGAMNFGDAWKNIMGECGKVKTFEILDYFHSQGGNFIDTANNYQNGESEQWIGEWMKVRDNRDQMVIATKYTSNWKLAFQGKEIISNFGGNNKKSLQVSVEASIARLQTSYIDLLYVHSWDFTTSIQELMHSLHHVVMAGKALYLGISNTPAWVVVKCNEYARQNALTVFSVYQGRWSAACRDMEREIIPMCQAEGMAVVPFMVLGGGYFKTAAQRATEGEDREGRKIDFIDSENNIKLSETLEKVAQRKCNSIAAVALAWVMHKSPYVFPVLGGRKIEHLKTNIEALSLKLSKEDMKEIEAAVPFDFGYPQTSLGLAIGATRPEDVYITKRFGRFDWVKGPQPIEPHENEDLPVHRFEF